MSGVQYQSESTTAHDVSHCRILSPDKTEWRLISATLCGWRRCFVVDQLWFIQRIREEEEEEEEEEEPTGDVRKQKMPDWRTYASYRGWGMCPRAPQLTTATAAAILCRLSSLRTGWRCKTQHWGRQPWCSIILFKILKLNSSCTDWCTYASVF